MKKFKVLSLILSLFLVAGISGCDNAASTNAKTSAKNGKVVVLKAWVGSSLASSTTSVNQMNTKIGKLIAAKTGVAFDSTWLNSGEDVDTAFNLMLASGGFKDYDVIFRTATDSSWVDKLVKLKLIKPINSYFTQPEKYPNLAKISQKVIDNCKSSDGQLYGFPSNWYEDPNSKFGFWSASGWYVLPQYLKAVNMTEKDLSTIGGVETFLKAVKAKNLKTSDGLRVLPMSFGQDATFADTLLNTFGVTTGGNGYDTYNGKLLNYRDNPQTKVAFQWMNKLYNEGLIDQEVVTQKNDQFTEKLMNSRVALVMDTAMSFWTAVTTGKNAVTNLAYLHSPSVQGVSEVGTNTIYDPYGASQMFITSTCKDPDAVAKLADWGSATGSAKQWELAYGPIGTTWDYDPKLGKPYFDLKDPEIKAAMTDYSKMVTEGFGTEIGVAPFGLDLNYYQPAQQSQLFWIFNMHKFYSVVPNSVKIKGPLDKVVFTADGAWNTNISILKQVDTTYFYKLVSCSSSDFEKTWNEYRQQLEKQGHWTAVNAEFLKTYNDSIK